MYLASVNSFGTISDTPFLSPKCPQYYLRPSPPHCGDMMTFVPNGINQGALALPAKHESCWQIEFGAPVLGLLTCGARSWRGTAVPWLQPKRCLSLLQFPASSIPTTIRRAGRKLWMAFFSMFSSSSNERIATWRAPAQDEESRHYGVW